MDYVTCSTWFGRPMTELSREELLEVVEHCGKEIQALRGERSRLGAHIDWRSYLMAPALAAKEPVL